MKRILMRVARADCGSTAKSGSMKIANDVLCLNSLGLDEAIIFKYNPIMRYNNNVREWMIDTKLIEILT